MIHAGLKFHRGTGKFYATVCGAAPRGIANCTIHEKYVTCHACREAIGLVPLHAMCEACGQLPRHSLESRLCIACSNELHEQSIVADRCLQCSIAMPAKDAGGLCVHCLAEFERWLEYCEIEYLAQRAYSVNIVNSHKL